MSDEELIAKSIEYAALDLQHKFEKDCNAKLITAYSVIGLDFKTMFDQVVLHKVGGGAIPFKVGGWELTREVIGSIVSVGVYKKHS